jgi:signal transduction histidine kinase
VARQRPRWWPVVADGLITAVALTIGLLGTGPAGANQHIDVDGSAYPWVVAAALALAVRRRWPLATLAVSTTAVSAYLVLGQPYGPILFSLVVAVYSVASRVPLPRAAVACGVALVVVLLNAVVGPKVGLVALGPQSAWIVVPFALGVTVRLTREAAARTRQEEARRVADEERLRIAQEVHDVVGHGLAAINMQAEIALHLLAKRPDHAASALAAISRSSKEALDELRVTLAVVRRGREADAAGFDRAPTAGLAQVEALRTRLAGVGLPVSVRVEGERRPLPAAVDLAAYRVIQESLTNVLRHAGAATASVLVEYRDGQIAVTVTDTGPGGSRPAGGSHSGGGSRSGGDPRSAGGSREAGERGVHGHGLAGMRERVTALGGQFEAGPHGSGFRVYALVPVEERA